MMMMMSIVSSSIVFFGSSFFLFHEDALLQQWCNIEGFTLQKSMKSSSSSLSPPSYSSFWVGKELIRSIFTEIFASVTNKLELSPAIRQTNSSWFLLPLLFSLPHSQRVIHFPDNTLLLHCCWNWVVKFCLLLHPCHCWNWIVQIIFFSASAGTELCRLSSSPPLLVWNSSVCLLLCFCRNWIVQIIFFSTTAGMEFFSLSSSLLLLELNCADYLLLHHCWYGILQFVFFSASARTELYRLSSCLLLLELNSSIFLLLLFCWN